MLLFYLISIVIFPQMKINTEVNFKEHYDKNSRILFIIFSIYLVFTIVGSFVYMDKDKGDVLTQNLIRTGGIILCIFAAIFSRKKWIHYIFLTLNFIGLIMFILAIPR